MKKFNRKDFLNLPNGILFYRQLFGEEDVVDFGSLCIKRDSYKDDFSFTDLNHPSIVHNGCDNFIDVWINSLSDGINVDAKYDNEERDGMFNNDEIFFVLDINDVVNLEKEISKCLNNYQL